MAAIAFDAATHRYTREDGTRVPSVTHILQATGVALDFDALADARGPATREAIEAKRALGSVVHADIHALDDGDLVWETVDPRSAPYVAAWQRCKDNLGLVSLSRERRVYHRDLGYAGTLDAIVLAPDGHHVLVDLKLGDPESAGCRYQTALYQLAWQTGHNLSIDERWGVWLRPDLRVPYRLFPYREWRDLEVARAIVTTYYAQPRRRAA